jgi:hypothetical protein
MKRLGFDLVDADARGLLREKGPDSRVSFPPIVVSLPLSIESPVQPPGHRQAGSIGLISIAVKRLHIWKSRTLGQLECHSKLRCKYVKTVSKLL